MKRCLCWMCLLFALQGLAQEPKDPFATRVPLLLVQTGIGMQWFGDPYKLFVLTVERPRGRYWHWGIQGAMNFKKSTDYSFYYYSKFLGGFELSGFGKYFPHGRFSGHKSGLFFGPDLRFGIRRFQALFDQVFPPPPVPDYQTYKEHFTKVLLRWGIQWQFDHATFELAAPFGAEFYRPTALPGLGYNGDARFVMLPTLQFGLAF